MRGFNVSRGRLLRIRYARSVFARRYRYYDAGRKLFSPWRYVLRAGTVSRAVRSRPLPHDFMSLRKKFPGRA